jgi:hypothetical protein
LLVGGQFVVIGYTPRQYLETKPGHGVLVGCDEVVYRAIACNVLETVLHNVGELAALRIGQVRVLVKVLVKGTSIVACFKVTVCAEHPSADGAAARRASFCFGCVPDTAKRRQLRTGSCGLAESVIQRNNEPLVITVEVSTIDRQNGCLVSGSWTGGSFERGRSNRRCFRQCN